MNQAQSKRRRKVAKARNPLIPFYWGVGALLVLGVAFLITYTARGGFSTTPVSSGNAPIGQTAEGFWYKGNSDAKVKVIGYGDYQCPTCAYYEKNLAPIITRDYIETGKIQFIFHEFPLQGHSHALPSAEAARCAGDQGQFWAMHDMIFSNQDQWATLSNVSNVFSGYAGQIGLNRSTFDTCLSTAPHKAELLAAAQDAISKGITGTPSFSVNGQIVDLYGLSSAIEIALRAAANQ
ncbi:MAG: thioredoxin domain-containing protein [Chloroflexales bacterium]